VKLVYKHTVKDYSHEEILSASRQQLSTSGHYRLCVGDIDMIKLSRKFDKAACLQMIN